MRPYREHKVGERMIQIISHSAIRLLVHIAIGDLYIYMLSYRKLIVLSCDAIRSAVYDVMRSHIAYDKRNLVSAMS